LFKNGIIRVEMLGWGRRCVQHRGRPQLPGRTCRGWLTVLPLGVLLSAHAHAPCLLSAHLSPPCLPSAHLPPCLLFDCRCAACRWTPRSLRCACGGTDTSTQVRGWLAGGPGGWEAVAVASVWVVWGLTEVSLQARRGACIAACACSMTASFQPTHPSSPLHASPACPAETRQFAKKAAPGGGERTFVQFILEPLYKIYAQVRDGLLPCRLCCWFVKRCWRCWALPALLTLPHPCPKPQTNATPTNASPRTPSCPAPQILGEDELSVRGMMSEFGAALRASSYGMDVKPLVKEACGQIFGGSGGLVDMLVRHLPSSKAATAAKVERCYSGAGWRRDGRAAGCTAVPVAGEVGMVLGAAAASAAAANLAGWLTSPRPCPRCPCPPAGPQDSQLVEHMRACNPRGPLVIYICKLFPKNDCSRFDAFGRILSGTVKPGDKVGGWVGLVAAGVGGHQCCMPSSGSCCWQAGRQAEGRNPMPITLMLTSLPLPAGPCLLPACTGADIGRGVHAR
jgi:hypothetical protein